MYISLIDNQYANVYYEPITLPDGQVVPHIHAKIHKWSKDIHMNILWPLFIEVLKELKSSGYDFVYAATSHHMVGPRKFQEMFGFTKCVETGEGVVMSRSTDILGTA